MPSVLSSSTRAWIRPLLHAGVALALVVGLTGTAMAASSTAGDATPNFTESSGCDTYGLRGPLSQYNTIGSRIYGPYADFFGRTASQVEASTSWWVHPGGKFFRVHDRSLPAFQDAANRIISANTGYRATSGAAYNWRNVSASRQMSQHAVANAIDINPGRNPYTGGELITDMPASYVNAWRAAGFCWGGDWLYSKDAMHYTWMGPAATNGTTTRLAPMPPINGAANFTLKVFENGVSVPSDAPVHAMADRRREGADDLYGVVDDSGRWQVQVAGAVSNFATTGLRRTTAAPASGTPMLADSNGDGRADLWVFNESGTIEATVYLDEDRFGKVGRQVTTGAAWSPDAEVGLAVLDYADWLPDLYVFRRQSSKVEVYSSASGYKTMVYSATLPVSIGSDQVVLADRDGPTDGTADIWLIGSGPAAKIRVIRYTPASGYTGLVDTISTSMSIQPASRVMPGDYDGDGRIDLYVLTGGTLSVWLGGVPDRPLSRLSEWFTPDGPMTFDAGPICASSCDSIGYVDPDGVWRLAYEAAWAPEEERFYYGVPGDAPFMGDWDCDGDDTPGLYRRSDGYVYLRNSNSQGIADASYFFGNPGDIPIVGDFDGDGCDTVSIYRPSETRFYIINALGSADAGLGAAQFSFVFGDPGDKPFVGDFNGDGTDEIGLHRESTGRVYMRLSLTTGVADLDFIYGNPGDLLVAGDWDGDGVDSPALFRPSEGNWYLKLNNAAGFADHVVPFGLANRGFLPVAGRNGLAALGASGFGSSSSGTPAELEPQESS